LKIRAIALKVNIEVLSLKELEEERDRKVKEQKI
jgi:hypothetical protein